MPYKIRLRRDSAGAWTAANTTLGDGEAGYDSTNKRIKVGPGNWNDLSYVNGAGVTYNSTDNITSLAGTVEVGTSIVFEGATADTNETTLTVTDPTEDRTITLPDASGTVALMAGSNTQVLFNNNGVLAGDSGLTYNATTDALTVVGNVIANNIEVGSTIIFEGSGIDNNETILQVANPTGDRTITLPNATGTVALVAGSSGQIMFNSSGALAGDSGLTYSSGTDTLTVGTEVISGTFTASTKLAGPALEVTNQGLIKLFEGTGGTEYVGLRANSTLANTNIYTMPTAVGTANQVLAIDTVTGTDATLKWATATGGSGAPGGVSGQVQFNNSDEFEGDAGLTYDLSTDVLTVGGAVAISNQGTLRLFEGTGGTEYVGLRANSTLANTNIYTMPTTVGSANQVLAIDTVTGTDATLKWTAAGSGSPGGVSGQVQFNDGGSFNGDSGLTYNASTDALSVVGSVSTPTVTSGDSTVYLYNAAPVATIEMGGAAATVNIGNVVGGSTKNISIGTGGLGTTNITLGSTSGTCTINANGGILVGNATTQNVFNATATTVNAFGAATAINIGNNDSEVNGGAATTTIRGGTLVGNLTTQNVFNATATTVNAFGAATALTLGATSGTATLRNAIFTLSNATTVNINGANPTLASTATGTLTLFNTSLATVNAFGAATALTIAPVTATQTVNLATGATTGASTKTLNIGTNGLSSSGTTINLGTGSSGTVNLNLGSAVGSTTLNGSSLTLTNRGELRLSETGSNGNNYVGFKAADALAGNIVWELPAADGSANYVLSTNGSGVLSWVAQSGGGGSVATDTIWDAAGDLAIGDGPNAAVKLSRGSAGQVLTVNSAGTNIGWETPAPAVPDFVLYRLGIV